MLKSNFDLLEDGLLGQYDCHYSRKFQLDEIPGVGTRSWYVTEWRYLAVHGGQKKTSCGEQGITRMAINDFSHLRILAGM